MVILFYAKQCYLTSELIYRLYIVVNEEKSIIKIVSHTLAVLVFVFCHCPSRFSGRNSDKNHREAVVLWLPLQVMGRITGAKGRATSCSLSSALLHLMYTSVGVCGEQPVCAGNVIRIQALSEH